MDAACSNGGKEENGTSSEYPFLGEKTSYGSEVELRVEGGSRCILDRQVDRWMPVHTVEMSKPGH